MSSMVDLHSWQTRSAIWQHCNLWVQLCICVKDVGALIEGVPSNQQVCGMPYDPMFTYEFGWNFKIMSSLLLCASSQPPYTHYISSLALPHP